MPLTLTHLLVKVLSARQNSSSELRDVVFVVGREPGTSELVPVGAVSLVPRAASQSHQRCGYCVTLRVLLANTSST